MQGLPSGAPPDTRRIGFGFAPTRDITTTIVIAAPPARGRAALMWLFDLGQLVPQFEAMGNGLRSGAEKAGK